MFLAVPAICDWKNRIDIFTDIHILYCGRSFMCSMCITVAVVIISYSCTKYGRLLLLLVSTMSVQDTLVFEC